MVRWLLPLLPDGGDVVSLFSDLFDHQGAWKRVSDLLIAWTKAGNAVATLAHECAESLRNERRSR